MSLFPKIRHIHLVGIGGIGMSGIAEVLLSQGYRVTGSDLAEGQTCRRLRSLGARISIGHQGEWVGDAHVVVISSAIRPGNPEVVEAQQRGIPVIARAEMLAELMRTRFGVAVAGAHGKTTTTSMVAACLTAGGLDPTVIIGGRLNALGSNARHGQGQYMVAEADESDGSFLCLSPTIAVVTNIDPEHLDYYGSLEAIQAAFVQFVHRVPFYGAAVLCVDDPNVQKIMPEVRRHLVTYGFTPQAELRAEQVQIEGVTTRFEVFRGDSHLGALRLGMPGRHNALNALGATAAALELGMPFGEIAAALDGFAGVQRRFQAKGDADGVRVVDDYGHHPTEVRATLAAARAAFPERRILVVFQPHRYTRTRDLFEEFAGAFHDAHEVLLTEIYSAGEPPLPEISGQRLAEAIRARGHRGVDFEPVKSRLLSAVNARVRPGDILLTLGAGDVWKVGEAFLTERGQRVEGSQA